MPSLSRKPCVSLPWILVAPLLTGLSAAQGLPTAKVSVSVNEGAFAGSQDSGFGAFVQWKLTGSPAVAGAWCIPVADVRVGNPAFGAGLAATAWQHEFDATNPSMTVADLLGSVPTLADASMLAQPIAAHPADVGIVAGALGPTPWLGLAHADPIYGVSVGSTSVSQILGASVWPEWGLDSAVTLPTFNVDAILQATAWRRLDGHPGLAGATADQFFNSSNWTALLQAQPELSVTWLMLRAASIDPGRVPAAGAGLPPALRGFPNQPPRLGVTAPTKLSLAFVGSAVTAGRPWFKMPGAAQPILIPTAAIGGVLQLPMVGYAPGLEFALQQIGASSQRLELTASWASFGKVRMSIPTVNTNGGATSPGTYAIAAFRYPSAIAGVSGNPWHVIPSADRLRVLLF